MLKYKKSMIYVFISMLVALTSCNHTSLPADTAVKQITAKDSSLKWIDYQIGELPLLSYFLWLTS